jgi:hypothetical protein
MEVEKSEVAGGSARRKSVPVVETGAVMFKLPARVSPPFAATTTVPVPVVELLVVPVMPDANVKMSEALTVAVNPVYAEAFNGSAGTRPRTAF